MLGKGFGAVAIALVCILVIGLLLDFLRLFGVRVAESGSLLLVLPMGAVSWIASKGREKEFELVPEIVLIFVFIGTLLFVIYIGHWFFWLAWLGAYAATYYKKGFIEGWHHLFVVQPLRDEAKKQSALTQKLEADIDLAEATQRYERARAALEDAEREAEEAERRARGKGV